MKAIFNFLFFVLLGLSINVQLLKKNCQPEGADCDWAMPCCTKSKKLKCVNFRCTVKEEEEKKFWPDGPLCDWTHRCSDKDGKTFECVNHKCRMQRPKEQPKQQPKQQTKQQPKQQKKQQQKQQKKQQQKQQQKQQPKQQTKTQQ